MNDKTAGSVPAEFRARKLVATVQWAVVAAFGTAAFSFRSHGMIGRAGGAIGLYALQAAICSWGDVRVVDDGVTSPRPPFRPLPLLVLGRTNVAFPLLRDITAAGRLSGATSFCWRRQTPRFRPCSIRAPNGWRSSAR